MSTETIAPIGHNNPPVTIPIEGDMLSDLQRRYPEPDKCLKEWEDAFSTFPKEIPLEHEDVAKNLQDLIDQVNKTSLTWTDSFMKAEKKPINAILKVVGNFFTGRRETAQKLAEKWKPVHNAFMDKKKEAAIAAAEAEIERQREAERVSRAAAEAARIAQEESERKAEEKRKEEEAARLAAAKAEEERIASIARAEAAKEAERRQAEERKAREKAEKELIAGNLSTIKGQMKEAERLNSFADAEEISEADAGLLDAFIRVGGSIGELARPVAASMLLDEDQKDRINSVRARLGELRDAQNARFSKREQKRREVEAKAEQERMAAQAEANRKQREEDDRKTAEVRANRLAEEKAEKDANARKKALEADARAARDAAREHESSAKDAGKEAKAANTDADRSANRADRIDNKLEKSTEADLSRVRGDLGSVGSLGRHWTYTITDEDALRAAFRASISSSIFVTLFDQIKSEALTGAVFRFMRLHQEGWKGRERVADVLPGVTFSYELDGNIR